MAVKKGGLGRGLDALFEDNTTQTNEEKAPVEVRIGQVEPNKEQPRKVFDREAMEELADSIKEHGLLQPILVTPMENGQYQIVAGERRWRACRMAGLDKIPVLIRTFTRKQVMEIALIENLQREDLNPMEEAEGYARLMEEFDMTQEAVSARVGKSRPAVANALRLLALPSQVRKMLESGSLSAGHARAILSVDGEKAQIAFAKEVAEKGWSVRETERRSKEAAKPLTPPKKGSGIISSFAKEAELALSEKLGRKISVKSDKKGGGFLTIPYYNDDDLRSITCKFEENE